MRSDNLTELSLNNNRIGVDGAVAMATVLKDSHSLEKLNISWNSFGANGTGALIAAILHNDSLLALAI